MKHLSTPSGLLRRELTFDQVGDPLIAPALRTADCRLTAAEVLGPSRVLVLTKLYRSA